MDSALLERLQAVPGFSLPPCSLEYCNDGRCGHAECGHCNGTGKDMSPRGVMMGCLLWDCGPKVLCVSLSAVLVGGGDRTSNHEPRILDETSLATAAATAIVRWHEGRGNE